MPEESDKPSIPDLERTLLDTRLPLFKRYRAMFALRDLASPPDLPTAVPAIQALATAVREVAATREQRAAEISALRDELVTAVRTAVPDAILNGDAGLPGHAHFTFPGCAGDSLLMLLDAKGIECSTGSACTAGVAQPSHVLTAMGADPVSARGSLRLSLGHTSTDADIDAVLDVLPAAVERARQAALASSGRR